MHACLLVLCTALAGNAEPRPAVIVVVGAEGAPEFGRQFRQWAARWQEAAARGNADVTAIGLTSKPELTDLKLLKETLAACDRASPAPLWLILIGHGTFDGKTARFNLTGPDVAAEDLAEWLRPIERPLAVVNCASCSGPFINALSGPNRVVVSATKSGHEYSFARFGDYLSAAITDPRADLDKDEQTSLLEAFLQAATEVAEFYSGTGRLATEHALLDDNGDRLGTPADWFKGVRAVKSAKDGAAPDGDQANRWSLVAGPHERQLNPVAREQRDKFEQDLAHLRALKPTLPEDDYYRLLEPLLIDLARLYERAEQEAAAKK